jgi:hypothetical protein
MTDQTDIAAALAQPAGQYTTTRPRRDTFFAVRASGSIPSRYRHDMPFTIHH